MTEEVKNEVIEQEASPETPVEEKEDETSPDAGQEPNESAEVEEEVGSEASEDVDYKKELEKVQGTLKKAEHTIVELKKERKESTEGIDDRVKEEVNSQMNAIRADMAQDAIDDTLNSISSNEDEKNLIKFHYENSIKQTGFSRQAIENDLVNAKILANRTKIFKENSELKEALKAKKSISNLSLGANQDIKKPDKPKLSEKEMELLKRRAKGDPQKLKELVQKAISTTSLKRTLR